MKKSSASPEQRRSFLTRLNASAAAAAAVVLGGRALAQSKTPAAPFVPARHEQDNWMDELPGKHRLIFDATKDEALGEALLFANNFLLANRTGYGLQNSDMAVIITLRHLSTGFAFNDAMWAKYGAQLGPGSGLTAATPAKTNPRLAGGLGIDTVAKQGVQFAVCAMATNRLSNSIAQATGAKVEAITAELTANLVPNARMVPAGIVAISRAQERGYTLVTA